MLQMIFILQHYETLLITFLIGVLIEVEVNL
jgi:hypothetical protein